MAEPDWLQDFHRRVTGNLVPDRTYLVELDPETARARRADDSVEDDRMEAAGDDFYARVTRAYAELADAHPDRFVRLDGRRSIEDLHKEVWTDMVAMLDGESGTPYSGTGSSES
jgi:dTMP kinase